jgi:leucine dehydrogenase
VTVIDPSEIYSVAADVYAPCALGASVNSETIPQLKCAIIAGAANNQLANEPLHGQMLLDKGIIYAPDFALNAGGVINCFSEVEGLSLEWAKQKAQEIYTTIDHILIRSQKEGVPSYQVANQMAEERIRTKGSLNI